MTKFSHTHSMFIGSVDVEIVFLLRLSIYKYHETFAAIPILLNKTKIYLYRNLFLFSTLQTVYVV